MSSASTGNRKLVRSLRTMTIAGRTSLVLAGLAAIVAISLLIPGIVEGRGPLCIGVRNVIVCISMTGMAIAAYAAWPSRWNIPAHLQLAFSVPAYVVPLLGLDVLSTWPEALVATYVRLVGIGFVTMTAGVFIGRALAAGVRGGGVIRLRRVTRDISDRVRMRILVLTVACVTVLVACFAIMGFVPAFAEDPNAAKFFKGEYHAPYQSVSVPYRLTTSLVPLFMPLIGVYAWTRRKSAYWIIVLMASAVVMLLSLLREPAVSGILLAIGILVAFYDRFKIAYGVLVLASYVVGSAMYALLALLGVEEYQTMVRSGRDFLANVSSGAPDIKDQLSLLQAWLPGHELTLGRTFFGGLIPGNFPWNPSVWTLTTLNPGTDITEIGSGGLRMPAPLWGYVSFDIVGAIAVPLLSGVAIGFLTTLTARVVQGLPLEAAAVAMTVYFAAIEVFPAFYRLSYLSVLCLIVMAAVALLQFPKRGQPLFGSSGARPGALT